MRGREWCTVYELIASNYRIIPSGSNFVHQFTPKGTSTLYQVITTSRSPIVVEGDRYNLGYKEVDGIREVDISSLSNISKATPMLSFYAAIHTGREIYDIEKKKNDDRVIHGAKVGVYWGKKYAWRVFGACIAKEAFYSYLEEIRHPAIQCTVDNPPHPPGDSIAYLEDGLFDAMQLLMSTAVLQGRFYKSPHYSKQFAIKGLHAITDKK
jgi:hypothetical protein